MASDYDIRKVLEESDGYEGSVMIRTKVDDEFNIPKENFNQYIHDQEFEDKMKKSKKVIRKAIDTDNTVSLNPELDNMKFFRTVVDAGFKIPDSIVRGSHLSIKKSEGRTFSAKVSINDHDLLEFNQWIKGATIVPKLRSRFNSDIEYEDFIFNSKEYKNQ